QLGIRRPRVVRVGRRDGRQVDAIIDRRGGARRQEVVGELQGRRDVAGRVAGGRVDRDAFEIVARAVDQVALRVDLEVAAPRVAVDAAEHRAGAVVAGRRLHQEVAVAVDGHVGAGGRGLDGALQRVGRARACEHAAGDLLRRYRGARDQVLETRVDA